MKLCSVCNEIIAPNKGCVRTECPNELPRGADPLVPKTRLGSTAEAKIMTHSGLDKFGNTTPKSARKVLLAIAAMIIIGGGGLAVYHSINEAGIRAKIEANAAAAFDGDPKALAWLEVVANDGEPNAQRNLGTIYYHGNGVAADKRMALQWWLKAADGGDAFAQFLVGSMYEHGEAVNKDYEKALIYYRKAAQNGNEDAVKALESFGSRGR